MEDPTTHSEANSKSASKGSTSDTDQKKRGSGSTTSSKQTHNQEDSTTPKTNPPHNSQQQSTMGPPPKPNFKATPTSAQPSTSMSQASSQEPSQEQPAVSSQAIGNGDDQPAAPPKHPANNTTHATPRNKRSHVEVDQEPTAQDQDSSDEDAEPADQIASFDWNELENRYHHQMEHYAAQEQDLYQSFHELCKYFYVWAETGHAHEVERSFKRMKTQITLVQHNEEALESKRQHYVKVVEAFKSALQLLGGD